MEAERAEHRGRRDAETLRDAAEIHADKERVRHAMKHLEYARSAMERAGSGTRELRGKKRRGARESPRG